MSYPARNTLMFASAISGFFLNFARSIFSASVRSRSYIQHTNPSASMFLQRSMLLLSIPLSASVAWHSDVMGQGTTSHVMPSSAMGSLVLNSAFARSFSVNESMSMIIAPVGLQCLYCVLSAAGFIATSMSHSSPGVSTLSAPMCTWNPETPVSTPCGARISAG